MSLIKCAANQVTNFIKKYPLATGGLALGTALGGLPDENENTGKKYTKKRRIGNALAGAVGFGAMGVSLDAMRSLMKEHDGLMGIKIPTHQVEEKIVRPIGQYPYRSRIMKTKGKAISLVNTEKGIPKFASLIKLAKEQKSGIAGFTQRHPLLTAGIALTGGIAAADAGVQAVKAIKAYGVKDGFRSGLKTVMNNRHALRNVGRESYHGLKEGALYGGILSAVEPAILHGGLRKKSEV